MDRVKLLKSVELFAGLEDSDLAQLASLCREARFNRGEVITAQGADADDLYLVRDGMVEVLLSQAATPNQSRMVVSLGAGQIFGEMALVDNGPRSATVRAARDGTALDVIPRDAFVELCERNARIGYRVMRNIAADLSFKLRHHHLTQQ